jgi:hypothetical protein
MYGWTAGYLLTVTANCSLADDHLLMKPEFWLDAYKKRIGADESQIQQFEDSGTRAELFNNNPVTR